MTDIDPKQQLIDDADAINNFLEHEGVKRVFRAYDEVLWTQWKQSNDPAVRERLFAQARAFDDLGAGLRRVVASGKRETHELDPANRMEPLA